MKKLIFAFLATVLVFGSLNAQVLLTEDFEAFSPEQPVFPPDGWVLNATIGSQWTYGTTPYEGVYNAWADMIIGGNCGLMKCSWSTVPTVDPVLEFYYRGGYDYYGYDVGFTVEVSTTRCCPSQFVVVYDSGAFHLPDIYDPYALGSVDLSAYAGQDILLGFRSYLVDNPTYELQIDYVCLKSKTTADVLPTETFSLGSAPFPPTGWNKFIVDPLSPNDIIRDSTNAYDGISSARFSSYSSATNYTQYLVTKQFFVDPLDDNLTFWYKPYTYGTEQFAVGVSTQNTDYTLVTFGPYTYVAGGAGWAQYVENLGAYVGQNVYVWIKYDPIYMYYLYTDLYEFPDGSSESFEAGGGFPPAGWTVTTAGFGNTWIPGTSHDGDSASIDDGPLNSTHQDEYLITPTLDCSTVTGTQLTCWSYFYRSTVSGDSTAQVLGSIDDGATYPYEIVRWDLSNTTGAQAFDISSWADGQSQVKIAFRFSSSAETNDYDYWDVDDVYVGSINETVIWCEGFETVQPEVGWPPTGWSTVVYSGTGDWEGTTEAAELPPGGVNAFAIADSDSLGSGNTLEAGLFTASMDMSSIGPKIVNLKLDFRYDNIGSDYCEIRTYSGGVLQETLVTHTADFAMDDYLLTFDPNPAYPDLTDIQVEFYYNDAGSWAWEAAIDNVDISLGVAPPGFADDGDNDDNNAGFPGKKGVALKHNAQFQGN